MTESHYDHEQDERDYYDRENERRYRQLKGGCQTGLLFIVLMTLLIALSSSCRSVQIPMTSPVGVVISVDGDKVLVAFEVVSEEKTGSQAINPFYCPGHTYKKGDRYPDPEKYTHNPLPHDY